MIEAVKLGLMPPLSGIVELYGQEISHAGQIACQEINEQGGVLGRPLELVIEDDGSLPATAVPAALKLVEQHRCAAIIGNLLSNSRIAVASQVAQPLKIPYLNFSFYEGSISGRYFFHFAALPNQQIDRMIPYMAEKFGPKFFFAGNNYEWPRGSIDAAIKALRRCGGEVVGEEYFDIGTSNFSTLLGKIKRSGANVFVPYAAGMDQLNLLSQFTRYGLKQRMAVVMGHYDEAMASLLPSHVREGFYSSNTYFMQIDSKKNREYLRRLSLLPDIQGIWPNGNGVLTNFGEGTYLCVHAFAKAANLVGSLDAEALVDALETIQVDGPQGSVVMDPKTHHAHVNTYLSRCDAKGVFSIIEQFGQIAPVIPERYRQQESSATHAHIDSAGLSAIQGNAVLDEVAVILADAQSNIVSINKLGCSLWGGGPASDYLHRPLQHMFQGFLPMEVITSTVGNGDVWHGRVSLRLPGNDFCRLSINIEATLDDVGGASGLLVSCTALPDSRDINSYILEQADMAIVAVDQNATIIQVNHALCQMFAYSKQELLGLPLDLLLPPHMRQSHKKYFKDFLDSPYSVRQMNMRSEITGYKKDGSFFPAEATISKLDGVRGKVLIATIQEISRRKKDEEELRWRATHDPLTRLPSRNLILDRLANALARSHRSGDFIALLFIDVDEFKLINDNHGHEVGDQLLITIANRLLVAVRPGDTVARFGGDEFVVLCDQISDINTLPLLIERLIQAVKTPIDDAEHGVIYPSVSIGVAVGYGDSHSSDELLRNADAAMYSVKSGGRGGWAIFNEKIRHNSKQQLEIANGLRQAIANDELRTYFQPIVNIKTLEIVGAEALMRWHHNDRFISPAIFIPIAEVSGQIEELGEWIFAQSCQHQAEWRKVLGTTTPPYVSINLSARQLRSPKLVSRFVDLIKGAGGAPESIVLEITETTMMMDVDVSLKILRQFGEYGIRLAIDDFGTGHSSLSRINDLPIEILKVDQAFIRDIQNNHGNKTITAAVIDMAHRLDLKVTAEGVESPEQLDALKHIDCNNAQGYLFSKPIPADEFIQLLQSTQASYLKHGEDFRALIRR